LPGSRLYHINTEDNTSYIIGEGVLEIYEVPDRQMTFISLSPIFQFMLLQQIRTVKGTDKRYLLPTDDKSAFYGITLNATLKEEVSMFDLVLAENTTFSIEMSLTDRVETVVKQRFNEIAAKSEELIKDSWDWFKHKFVSEGSEAEAPQVAYERTFQRKLSRAKTMMDAKRKAISSFLISEADLNALFNQSEQVGNIY
jgi:hypothetical protein